MVTMDQSLTLSRAFEFIFMVCGQLMFDHVLCNKSYSLASHISSPTFLLGMSQIYSSISFLRQSIYKILQCLSARFPEM